MAAVFKGEVSAEAVVDEEASKIWQDPHPIHRLASAFGIEVVEG